MIFRKVLKTLFWNVGKLIINVKESFNCFYQETLRYKGKLQKEMNLPKAQDIRTFQKRLCFFKKSIRDLPFGCALDLGCNNGVYMKWIKEKCPNLQSITGIDIDQTKLNEAQQYGTVIHGNIELLETWNHMKGKQFMLILASQILEHTKNPTSILDLCHNHLKNKGILVLGVPNEGAWIHRMARTVWNGYRTNPEHLQYFTEKQIRRWLHESGFVVIDCMREVFYIGWDRWYYPIKRTRFGWHFLNGLTKVFPSQCSDFYLVCRKK